MGNEKKKLTRGEGGGNYLPGELSVGEKGGGQKK